MLLTLIQLGIVAAGTGLAAYGTTRLVMRGQIAAIADRDPREVMGPLALVGSVLVGGIPGVGPLLAPVLLMFGLGNVVSAVTNRAQLAAEDQAPPRSVYTRSTAAPLPAR